MKCWPLSCRHRESSQGSGCSDAQSPGQQQKRDTVRISSE